MNTETARQSMAGKSTTSRHSPNVVVMHCQTCVLCSGRTTWLSLMDGLAVPLLQKETTTNVSNIFSILQITVRRMISFDRLQFRPRCNLFRFRLKSRFNITPLSIFPNSCHTTRVRPEYDNKQLRVLPKTVSKDLQSLIILVPPAEQNY